MLNKYLCIEWHITGTQNINVCMVVVRSLVINNMLHNHHFTVSYSVNILNGSCQKLLNDKKVLNKFSLING